MMRRRAFCLVALAIAVLSVTAQALPEGISYHVQGGTLSNTGDYDWWYGCSPTSAGMLVGYYDRSGYGGLSYSNLVPGGVAEASTFDVTPGTWEYLVQYVIASPGHVNDFYGGGNGASGDDVAGPFHSFDSLADFMGTSQDSVLNANGGTTFYYYNNGAPLPYADVVLYGLGDLDGMVGMGEYIDYSGYSFTTLYTQLTDNQGLTYGFTFEDYKDEIDAGRGVMIHVENHTMAGIGYDGDNILLYDTWSLGPHTMPWGGAYSGLTQWGVTVFELTGGQPMVPAPGAVVLASIGVGLVGWIRRRHSL